MALNLSIRSLALSPFIYFLKIIEMIIYDKLSKKILR